MLQENRIKDFSVLYKGTVIFRLKLSDGSVQSFDFVSEIDDKSVVVTNRYSKSNEILNMEPNYNSGNHYFICQNNFKEVNEMQESIKKLSKNISLKKKFDAFNWFRCKNLGIVKFTYCSDAPYSYNVTQVGHNNSLRIQLDQITEILLENPKFEDVEFDNHIQLNDDCRLVFMSGKDIQNYGKAHNWNTEEIADIYRNIQFDETKTYQCYLHTVDRWEFSMTTLVYIKK